MKFNATLFALFLGILVFVTGSFAADTLEVFALRVQFQEEGPDNGVSATPRDARHWTTP